MMDYITEVTTERGRFPSFRFPTWEKGTDIVAIVYDNTGRNHIIQSKTNLSSELIGFGIDINESSGFLVENTAKTAKFIDYVKSAETGYVEYSEDVRDVIPHGSDSLSLDNGYVPERRDISGYRRMLTINTSIEAIEVCGFRGSVASRSGTLGVNPSLLTLYDLFGELCRQTRLNLMRYHKLRLQSAIRGRCTDIVLTHTDESERFFTKMYLDVMRK